MTDRLQHTFRTFAEATAYLKLMSFTLVPDHERTPGQWPWEYGLCEAKVRELSDGGFIVHYRA